jgi:chromate transporter
VDTRDAVGQRASLAQIALLFLKLGTIGFGGPAAHIALMEDEVVHRRRWLTRDEFIDYVGATNLIPGPNSTELAIAIGRDRAGWPGLIVAGIAFIAPAAVIVSLIAWAYVEYGRLPAAVALLTGVKPVIIAIVAHALWRLARTAVKNAWLLALAVGAVGAIAAGANELVVLLGAGLLAAAFAPRGSPASAADANEKQGTEGSPDTSGRTRHTVVLPALGAATLLPVGATLWQLFAIFLKIGSVLFGSGYVLLAFLRADFVERLGWLTEQQLLDAVVVGQVTPGPVFTTATFIGYVLAGIPGGIVATAGIFLPAFLLVAASGPLVPRIRRSPVAGAALDGVNVASVALMLVVTWQLGRSVFVDLVSIVTAVIALVVIATRRVSPTWVILAAALIGIGSAVLRQ